MKFKLRTQNFKLRTSNELASANDCEAGGSRTFRVRSSEFRVQSFVLAFAALCLLAGCEKGQEQRDALDTADKRMKVGAFAGAAQAYEAALDGTEKTAEVHYKLAMLYDEKLKSPLDAIHHYERYLTYLPKGGHAKEATTAKADCEKRLQTKMSKEGLMSTAEAVRLRGINERLTQRIAELSVPRPNVGPRTANPDEKDPLPPGAKQYVVAKGDTLALIAMKFYKNRAMASHIKDANFNQLGGKDILHLGQTLIIPELPAKKKR